mgnify:CR=1 FL=1
MNNILFDIGFTSTLYRTKYTSTYIDVRTTYGSYSDDCNYFTAYNIYTHYIIYQFESRYK